MRQQARFVPFALLVLVAALLPAVARPVDAQPAPDLVDRAGGPYNGIDVTLTADAPPAPGGVVTLTLSARPLRAAPTLYVEWSLPDGGTLDGPALEQLGPVASGQTTTITRHARFDAAGVYAVQAKAFYAADPGRTLAALGVLFFTVGDRPTVTDLDPRTPVYAPPADRPTVDKSALAGGSGRAADGCFNVTGLLSRENKMPSAVVVPEPGLPPGTPPIYNGVYTDQTGSAVPVHHILVEMREEDTFSDDSYGHTVTDANGRFNFSFCDDDGFLNDELELYFRVCAEVRDGNNFIARIENEDDRELYCWDSGTIDSEGGTVDFDLSVYRLNQAQASVFNIADAIYWGWRGWNDAATSSPAFDRTVTVMWQGGKGRTGSFYNQPSTTMVIADDPSSTDHWDDSVIIHEWGHFADNQFSCYQNPGGAHTLPGVNNGVNGPRLAWGEGYPDYFQSVARQAMPGSASVRFYVDPSGPTVDLENMRAVTATDRDEGAVAALLWDFADAANDGSDTVNHGHAAVQQVYATGDFQGNTQCDLRRFLQVWRKQGLPTNAATAATIVQNANITLASLPAIPLAAAANVPVGEQPAAPAAPLAAPPLDFRWWNQVTMVVDRSASMAGPPGAPKINTVKTIIGEQVSDLAPRPQGTEFNIYTFDAGSSAVAPLVQGKFFAPQIMPAVNGLVANGPDAGCPVPGLGALSQAITDKFDGQAWLYTDGDSADSLTPEQMRLKLNERRLTASIVLLGGCGSPARKPPEVSGAERTYLSLAADGSQPSGIVPYMLTSLLSGGQFIYVAPDQLANAVDVVRAQLSHTAGAGRWSDYVSNVYTYRWDRLESWEYQWFPAESLGQDQGQLFSDGKLLTLPQPFNFYGDPTTQVRVGEDGYINMDPCTLANPDFCPLTYPYLNLLYSDLKWAYISDPNRRPASPDENGPQVHVYTANFGLNEWHIISTQGIGLYGPGDTGYRAYQAWLNFQTGEIRFLYDDVRNEAATSEISLEESFLVPASKVLVSQNDFSGATDDMGYKFTPAPPQPTKIYDVDVDPLIGSVIFLQTGYSGTFAPLSVSYPDGSPVNCADTANVKCLTMDSKPGDRMVQFVQVNTNGRSGVYTAVVGVGPSGGGTFSFNALAASDLRASSPDPHTIALKGSHSFLLDLGRATDNGRLDAWLQTPAGAAFGDPFTLFDDGNHNDGAAGDGRFGSGPFAPPGAGAAYLWVEGTTGGVAFKRNDPAPFNFQPLYIWQSLAKEGYYGTPVELTFWVENLSSGQRCYAIDFTTPPGWDLFSPEAPSICIPGQTTTPVFAYVSKALGPDLRGESGEIGLTMTELEEGAITASESATVRLFRPPAALAFDNRQVKPLPPGDSLELTLVLFDDLGQIIGTSGPFNGEITATKGTVELPTGNYEDGRLRVIFHAGGSPGVATISAIGEGGLTAETTVLIAAPTADTLELTASTIDLSAANQSQLTVTVRDTEGQPAKGETVRLIVSDDAGDQGKINGADPQTNTFEGATNAQGQLKATFVKTPGGQGPVVVRAELLNGAGEVIRETSITLYLSGVPADDIRLFLPVVSKPR